MSNYDNWKTQTPEDNENDERERIDKVQARIERLIDGREARHSTIGESSHKPHKGIDRSHDFDYDPFNP